MTNVKSITEARAMVDSMAQSFIFGVLRSIQRAEHFAIWLMCDWRQVSYYSNILIGLGYPTQSCIVWDKLSGVMGSRYHPRHELILFATDKLVQAGGYLGHDVVQCPRPSPGAKSHAFEKPPELVLTMCRAFEAGRVLDPFAGTGGLLIGAKQLGWEVAGIEVEKPFVDIANERLKHTIPLETLPPIRYQTQLF